MISGAQAVRSDDSDEVLGEVGSGPTVTGTVRLMTDEPVELGQDGGSSGSLQRLSEQLERRPWVIPAVLLGALALFLALRRR